MNVIQLIIQYHDSLAIKFYLIALQTFGSEFVHPGKSPLECLVECFSDLSTQLVNSIEKQDTLSNCRDYVSLTGSWLADALTLLEETLSLAWLLLGHGAEHAIRDETRKTPLHNTLLHSRDTRLAEVLCDNGADVNNKDLFGNTPLMALCSSYPWGSSSAFGPCVASEASASCSWSYEAVRFVLKQRSCRVRYASLDLCNCTCHINQNQYSIMYLLLDK